MKIIARTASGFLLEAIPDEVAKIVGHAYAHECRERGMLEIGSVIHVSDTWNRIEGISASSEKLCSTARTLRAIADLLDSQGPGISAAVKEG